jgi:hypothetical protein
VTRKSRHIEIEVAAGKEDFVAVDSHGALVDAVGGAELVAGAVAFDMKLDAEGLGAGLE